MSGRNESGRSMRLGAIFALAATLGAVLATAANAGPPIMDTVHVEESDVLKDFCDVAGLDVTLDVVMDIRVHINPHGPDGVQYYLQHGIRREVLTANERR